MLRFIFHVAVNKCAFFSTVLYKRDVFSSVVFFRVCIWAVVGENRTMNGRERSAKRSILHVYLYVDALVSEQLGALYGKDEYCEGLFVSGQFRTQSAHCHIRSTSMLSFIVYYLVQ